MKYDCIIIGGGASGLMLAARLKVNNGLIVEGTHRLGTKMLMSGGGRCNITHEGSIKDFVDCYGRAGHVLRKCLYRHNNLELINWLNTSGIPTISENGRIFPASMKASDIVDFLVNQANANGWRVSLGSKVRSIEQKEGYWIVNDNASDNVVIAAGGITYPKTGSDGSMFEMLRELGISIVEPRSVLAPIYVRDYPYGELSGVSVTNVTVTAFSSDAVNTCKGKAARMTGDILFTHNGFSGPVILNISKYAEPDETIRINYNRTLDELPRSLRRCLGNRARGSSGDIKTSRLTALLEADDFIVESIDKNGMVTCGGINLDEINTATMGLNRYPGLFAIGEAIDADGITGGYNLQMCYSTACTVADNL